jgi:hypothetical protein
MVSFDDGEPSFGGRDRPWWNAHQTPCQHQLAENRSHERNSQDRELGLVNISQVREDVVR